MKKMNNTIDEKDLYDILEPPVKEGGHQKSHYISTCPFCGKEKHFYINRKTQLFDCKKCEEEGNIFKLLQKLDKLFLIGDFKSIDRKSIKLLSEYNEEKEEDEEIVLNPEVRKLPKGFKRIYESEYLENERGFKKSVFEKYRIGKSIRHKEYVIISVDEENKCRGYLMRLAWGKEKMERVKRKNLYMPKRWLNDSGCSFSLLLFGYDEINSETTTIILVEGAPDKITLDDILGLDKQSEIKCLATFGKKISSTQIAKLLKKDIKNVILIFDEDAIKQMKKYSVELSKFFNVKLTFTYGKDINDSTKEEVLKIFDRLETTRNFNRKYVKLL